MTTPPRLERDQVALLKHYLVLRDRAQQSNQAIVLTVFIRRGQPPVFFRGTVESGRERNDTPNAS